MSAAPEVLFVCVHNAGRSQMAAALLQHHSGGRVAVRSAGSAPADTINPAVVEVMRELGIDLIITDHHEPDVELPVAVAVINPRRHDCAYPDKNLAGVGVALFVPAGEGGEHEEDDEGEDYGDDAGIVC